MAIDKRWSQVDEVPANYTKKIVFGNLKGKSDINPQWRIKAMTETYGLQGEGWRWVETHRSTFDCPDGQVMCFVKGQLSYRDYNEEKAPWSDPIEGNGGDFLIKKNKNGLVANDEAWKMCTTDAMGNAMKGLGVASKVYEGSFDGSKYNDKGTATPSKISSDQVMVLTKTCEGDAMVKYFTGRYGPFEDVLEQSYDEILSQITATVKKQKGSLAGEIKGFAWKHQKHQQNAYNKYLGTLNEYEATIENLVTLRDHLIEDGEKAGEDE